jgi:hypothetical protein
VIRGTVDDGLRIEARGDLSEHSPVGSIARDPFDGKPAREPAAVPPAVERRDVVAVVDQLPDGVAADETGIPGHGRSNRRPSTVTTTRAGSVASGKTASSWASLSSESRQARSKCREPFPFSTTTETSWVSSRSPR